MKPAPGRIARCAACRIASRVAATVASGIACLLAGAAPLPAAATALDEIVVTANRLPTRVLDVAANTSRIDTDEIERLGPTHFSDVATEMPGTWISRGSGQENLTAIRSPVLTGPGSCGSFLVLEDGMPTRPTGFCNVNEFLELPYEQAAAIEVIRGPANALYGSNALHGTLNILLPEPGESPPLGISAETGPSHFVRGSLLADLATGDGAHTGVVGGLLFDHDGGFRPDSGYRQAKGFVKFAEAVSGGRLELGASGNLLRQDTAGYITGKDSYKDESLRLANADTGAYRDADSQRFNARWQPAGNTDADGWDLRVTARRSAMEFLQHYLPGSPVERNGQASGAATLLHYFRSGRASVTMGLDLEIARGWLDEFQDNPETGMPPRPAGQHYDYSVWEWTASPYAQAQLALSPRLALVGGVRLEWLRYDYDNHMLSGDTRADGTACVPACLFYRPADRSDSFTNLAPNVGLVFRVDDHNMVYSTLTRGFRAPQAAELYRLQAGQQVADLGSEHLDSLELGWRWQTAPVQLSLATYAMRKGNYIFQDSNRFNVSGGRSHHVGVELGLDAHSEAGLYASLAASWSRQTYAFSKAIAGGETIVDGNDIDSAPRTLGSLTVGWKIDPWLAEAQWVHQGSYYLTAADGPKYGGHDLLNLRAAWQLSPAWRATVRLNNATDRLYADRADYAFGQYRYFPGREREAYVELAWELR